MLFSRDPSSGAFGMMGEFLANAQGEDVVAGIRTPLGVSKMPDLGDGWAEECTSRSVVLCQKLETAYRDMVDIEFTVQKGQLFILQSRVGKRSARAAFKIAVDLVNEGVIDKKAAIGRLTADQFKVVRRPMIDPAFKVKPRPDRPAGLPRRGHGPPGVLVGGRGQGDRPGDPGHA